MSVIYISVIYIFMTNDIFEHITIGYEVENIDGNKY